MVKSKCRCIYPNNQPTIVCDYCRSKGVPTATIPNFTGETATQALERMFKEMGAKVVTITLTKAQQREWDKRDKEIEKFLEDKYTSQENAKKCKMVFKSGIRTVQTPASARRVAAVKCANHGKVNGNTSSKQKTAISVKLPKNWGKVRVGKCLVQF